MRTATIALEDADYERAAELCRRYRRKFDLRQMDLAVALRCDLASISRIENQNGKRPSAVVAMILDLDPDTLHPALAAGRR